MGLPGGSETINYMNTGDRHSAPESTLCFLNGPPPTIKIGQSLSVTIGLPSARQLYLLPLSNSSSEAIHLSLRLAENNAAANLLSGNLTSTISRVNGHSPSSVTFNGIQVTKAGRFRMRVLLGIDSSVGVGIASTVDSDMFEVLA